MLCSEAEQLMEEEMPHIELLPEDGRKKKDQNNGATYKMNIKVLGIIQYIYKSHPHAPLNKQSYFSFHF